MGRPSEVGYSITGRFAREDIVAIVSALPNGFVCMKKPGLVQPTAGPAEGQEIE